MSDAAVMEPLPAADVTTALTTTVTAPPTAKPINAALLSPGEAAALKAAQARERKERLKAKKAAEAARQHAADLEAEMARAKALAESRWRDCLQCLRDNMAKFSANPYTLIHEPIQLHDYLDALTETLANLSQHQNEMDDLRVLLQATFESFVDWSRFAKYQPAFYIDDEESLRRFTRLIQQCSHPSSDKALLPHILILLGPSFERIELHPLLVRSKIVSSLLSFAREGWIPNPATFTVIISILEQVSHTELAVQAVVADSGYARLQSLAHGTTEGLTAAQQAFAQQALSGYPYVETEEEEEEQPDGTNGTRPTTTTTSG